MRYLAVARFRLLTTIRAGSWVFALSLAAAVLPVLISGLWVRWVDTFAPGGVLTMESHFRSYAGVLLQHSAGVLLFVYAAHILVVNAACQVFGSVRRRTEEEVGDLMDTVPLAPAARFWGDALGIFASVMIIHLCTLPFLALVLALSPFSSGLLFYLELVVLAVVILDSAGASSKLHVYATRRKPPPARSAAIFLIIFSLVLISSTRWAEFRDAAAWFVSQPSPLSWSALVAAIGNPALLLSMIAMLYAAFIVFFHIRAIRSFERR